MEDDRKSVSTSILHLIEHFHLEIHIKMPKHRLLLILLFHFVGFFFQALYSQLRRVDLRKKIASVLAMLLSHLKKQ